MATISQLNGDDLQAKKATYSPTSMYNIGEGDSYVENGDGTVTITRVWDGVTYTETVPENVPLNTLDANMSNIVRSEIEKTLNLLNPWSAIRKGSVYTVNSNGEFVGQVTSDPRPWNYSNRDITITLPAGTYTISAKIVSGAESDSFGVQVWSSDGEQFAQLENSGQTATFTITEQTVVGVEFKPYQATVQMMLNRGSAAYPFQTYSGKIVHEIQVPIYFSTTNTSPASIIGGDWTRLGSFSIGSNTVYAWRKA